jgi:hypothetical protein
MPHTPRPWEYGIRRDKSIWLSLGDPKSGPHYQGDLVASEADARLIAAAPDLLEALKGLVANDCTFWRDAARAAIAKAEGK